MAEAARPAGPRRPPAWAPGPTTRNRHNNVNLFAESDQFERLTDDHLVRLTTEILFNGLVVYQNAATA